MTEPAYTDDDVEALAKELMLAPLGRTYGDRARRLLDAGYRKVTPDAPPEPQERYLAQSALLVDTSLNWQVICPDPAEAKRIARCLNLDAKYEDHGGVAKMLEDTLRGEDEARAEVDRLAAELAKERISHDNTVDQRDEYERWADKLAYAIAPQSEIGEHTSGNNPWANALDLVPAPADPRDDGPTEIQHIAHCMGENDPHPACPAFHYVADMNSPRDDGPTAPLFTGYVGVHGGPSFAQVPGSVGVITVMADTGLRVNDRVDVYPHGQRPTDTPTSNASVLRDALETIANGQECTNFTGTSYCRTPGMGRQRDAYYGADRWCDTCIARDALDRARSSTPAPVTAEMVAQGMKEIGALDLTADGCAVLAVKLNKRVGADTPTSNQPVTAEMVQHAVAPSWLNDDEAAEVAGKLNERIGARTLPTREQVHAAAVRAYDGGRIPFKGEEPTVAERITNEMMALLAQPTGEGERA